MTVDILLYTSKTNKDGTHPLVLRLTDGSKRKYKNLGRSFTKDEWNFEKNRPKKDEGSAVELLIISTRQKYLKKQTELMEKDQAVTMDQLVEEIERPSQSHITVHDYFASRIASLIADERLGNAGVNKDAYRSLLRFQKKKIYFSGVNYNFLTRYESHMRRRKLADTTMSKNMRTLKALYNEAVKDEAVKLDGANNPFVSYEIGKRLNTETRKLALSPKESNKLAKLTARKRNPLTLDSKLYTSYLYFWFSYYSQGMSFSDIAKLRWEDIDYEQKVIRYSRVKTGKIDDKQLLPEAEQILHYFKTFTNPMAKQNYVLPILNVKRHITLQQQKNRIHKVIGKVNKDLKELAAMAGIDVELTTYVARHTMASDLQLEGVSLEEISRLMNHGNENTTRIYLKGLTTKRLHTAASKLSKRKAV